jgi:single-stranded-DNA-specific exonuclease
LGLVANSCAEEYGKPAFLWGRDGDGIIKGSCRSGGTVSVVQIMHKVPAGVLTQYGGHFASGGFAVSNEAIHHFDDHLNSAYDLLALEPQEVAPKYVDMEIPIDSVDWNMSREIEKLAPFGVGNPKPVFLFKKITPSAVKRFGKGNEHLELVFNKSNGQKIPAISFFGVENDWAKTIQIGQPIDLVASVEKSMFRGRAELRLRVVDVI